MRILLIVHFHETPHQLRDPSPLTGMYAQITEDERVLAWHGVNLNYCKEWPMHKHMDDYFFSEHWNNRFHSYKKLNVGFKEAYLVVNEPHDRIVICEV